MGKWELAIGTAEKTLKHFLNFFSIVVIFMHGTIQPTMVQEF